MKKVQLIEWGIIVVGIVFGYKFFESIFTLFVQVIYSFDSEMYNSSFLVKTLLLVVLYAVGFMAIIRNSHKLASFLNGGAVNDLIPLKIGRRSALQIVLIAICATQVFSGIATIVIYLYQLFQSDVSRSPLVPSSTYRDIDNQMFKIEAVKIIVALVVICFSKDLSNLFFRKNEPDELVLESIPTEENPQKPDHVQ